MVMGYLRDREGSIAGPTLESRPDSYSANSGTSVYSSGVRGRRGPDVFGQSASALEAETNRALAHVRDWGDRKVEVCTIENQRDGAHQKTEVRCPGHSHGQTEIALVDEIRL
ncbi:hypothetical protein EVAR_57750_1 [Eumeta japonica]|uniref:Uncharacterized protein n=1 Tax=Eumeta variegata TaxID=151549 RepID=A0A4C1ZWV8_EUMVA|nr:hypothetical protein EVAR_57750_1 [Eumeta japonica]